MSWRQPRRWTRRRRQRQRRQQLWVFHRVSLKSKIWINPILCWFQACFTQGEISKGPSHGTHYWKIRIENRSSSQISFDLRTSWSVVKRATTWPRFKKTYEKITFCVKSPNKLTLNGIIVGIDVLCTFSALASNTNENAFNMDRRETEQKSVKQRWTCSCRWL